MKQPIELSMQSAIAILIDPEGFFPQQFHDAARKYVEENGNEEQKKILSRETVVRGSQLNRMSSQHQSNARMGKLQ